MLCKMLGGLWLKRAPFKCHWEKHAFNFRGILLSMTSLMLPSTQAILYIRSLPQMDKKDFLAEFPGANPQGKSGRIF